MAGINYSYLVKPGFHSECKWSKWLEIEPCAQFPQHYLRNSPNLSVQFLIW